MDYNGFGAADFGDQFAEEIGRRPIQIKDVRRADCELAEESRKLKSQRTTFAIQEYR